MPNLAEGAMTAIVPSLSGNPALPDHTQLPETDGKIVENFQEHPQSMLLTGSMLPVLDQRHPDGQYAIGHDSGIYFQLTDPPLNGCKAPDWFYIPGVPPLLNGQFRRSYVLWQEKVPPLLIVEYVSGDGTEERDTTPNSGKFWVYERMVRAKYYAIFEGELGRVELYRLVRGRYRRVRPNRRGHLPIKELGIELGIWYGHYAYMTLNWLRVWDDQGNLLPSAEERAEAERQQAEAERQRAEAEHQRAEDECQRAEAERQRAEAERQRAEAERQRAERLAARLRSLGIDPEAE
jgi:Uma2 family endonuclease